MRKRNRSAYGTQPGTSGIPIRKHLALATTAFGLVLPSVGQSQTAPPLDAVTAQKLIQRVNELESEVKALKSGAVAPSAHSAAVAAAATEATAAKDTYPQVGFHGFGDVTYHAGSQKGDKNAFALGQLDLFLSSRIAENLTIMSENVIEAGGDNNFGFEIERLLLQYRGSDWFNVDVGRYHSTVGYYNTAYHHGAWFQTATGRPQFLDFEDGGGLIPAHNVGLAFHGAVPSGSLNLNYALEIGNGRPYKSAATGDNPVLNISDDNEYKAFNLAFHIKPDGIPGLQLGAGLYHDTLTPEGLSRTDETLLHSHIVYKTADWEWLSEGFLMRHEMRGDGPHWTPAAYAQLARQFDAWRPYVRFSYINAPEADQALGLIEATGLRWGPSVGIRYDFSSLAAVKLQYDYVRLNTERNFSEFTGQVAFTF